MYGGGSLALLLILLFLPPSLCIKGAVDIVRCSALPLCSTVTVLPRSVT